MNEWFSGTPVDLAAILASREARAAKQKTLLREYGGAVICLLVNIPGAVKDCKAARKAFAAGAAAVDAMLQAANIPVRYRELVPLLTGQEGYWAVETPPQTLKRRCMALEEAHSMGRLWDLDVIDGSGIPLSRRTITGEGRRCMVCNAPAADCVSRQKHSGAELEAAILGILEPSERT